MTSLFWWKTLFWNTHWPCWICRRSVLWSRESTPHNSLPAWECEEFRVERTSCQCKDCRWVWICKCPLSSRHSSVVDADDWCVSLARDKDGNLRWRAHCHVHLRSTPSPIQDNDPNQNKWPEWFRRHVVCGTKGYSSDFRYLNVSQCRRTDRAASCFTSAVFLLRLNRIVRLNGQCKRLIDRHDLEIRSEMPIGCHGAE